MKKIVIILFLIVNSSFAEVVSVIPYVGYMSYNKDVKKSLKDKSVIDGIYANVGTLSYLLEFNYSHLDTTYKSEVTDINLNQNDFTLNYSQYGPRAMYKLGVHYTDTNDIVLGNALVIIASVGGYTYKGYDKYSYGVNMYYSLYKNGRDENQALFDSNGNYILGSSTSILQLSPYFSYFNSISINSSNLVYARVDYQYAFNYIQQNYLTFSLGDTYYYKSFFVDMNGYKGEMRSGIKNSGISLYNSLNLMKYGLALKLGYYLTPALVASVSYSTNVYQEYSLTKDTRNSIGVASLNYRF